MFHLETERRRTIVVHDGIIVRCIHMLLCFMPSHSPTFDKQTQIFMRKLFFTSFKFIKTRFQEKSQGQVMSSLKCSINYMLNNIKDFKQKAVWFLWLNNPSKRHFSWGCTLPRGNRYSDTVQLPSVPASRVEVEKASELKEDKGFWKL